MPVSLAGGSEANVLERRLVVELSEARYVASVQTFMGFDPGDIIDAEVAIYDADGRVVYRRSLHKESGNAGHDEEYDSPQSYSGPATRRLAMDAVCRVNGHNTQTGVLGARCHLSGAVTFEDGSTPPRPPAPPHPSECDIPAADDPGWGKGFQREFKTLGAFNAAKAAVGDRCGQDPVRTLALIAQAARDAGQCAVGPWDDEVAFLAADGITEGYHAVSFGNGCYTGNPIRDAWPRVGDTSGVIVSGGSGRFPHGSWHVDQTPDLGLLELRMRELAPRSRNE